MKNDKFIGIGDFETSVYADQTSTEVWASAVVQLYTEDVKIFNSIDETYDWLINLNKDVILYYHNLKFDGAFWLCFLLKIGYTQFYDVIDEDKHIYKWNKARYMNDKQLVYMISDMGQWYTITFKMNGHLIELRDSLKLLPFSVKKIGKSFGTKHKKLDMDYVGKRYAGCVITPKEREYIANDVLVVKEAIELMYQQGHDKLTIGSCCLAEFKAIFKENNKDNKHAWDEKFPDLYKHKCDEYSDYDYGSKSIGEYIHKSYKGGWCYLVKGKANKPKHGGTTADVNSLYPSMMSSESGNRYPVGCPVFWHGNYIPDVAQREDTYYFVRFRTRFYVKDGYLPFIQIKGTWLYKGTDSLETSDVYNKHTGEYSSFYYDFNNELQPAIVELTMTQTDFILMQEHYNLVDFEILDGCYFMSEAGLFDEYMEKYKRIKQNSTGATRELAKLFLNNLYGKMASSPNSSFKVAHLKEDGSLSFIDVDEHNKKAGYIPIGSAITSYARNFTIRAGQKNYHGVNKRGFIYADTDSIHCDLPPEEIEGIVVDDVQFCCWKLESCWDYGLFVRQKTYIEHVTHENCQMIEKPYYNIKCAGLPPKCKDMFLHSVMQDYDYENNPNKYTPEQIEWIKQKREIEDFKVGLVIPAKLLPKRIEGGIVLQETTYEMR